MTQEPIELILLRQCASYLATPIWLMGLDGSLLYYNEAAEGLVGRRFDEAGPMPLQELVATFQMTAEDGSPLKFEELVTTRALREQRPGHRSLRAKGLDGVWRSIELTAFPIVGQGGLHLGAVVIFWEADKP